MPNESRSEKHKFHVGKALEPTVMAMATPMKSINTPKLIGTVPGSFLNSLYNPQAIAHPKPKGKIIPRKPTLTAMRQLLIRNRTSTSNPTMKRNNIRPMLATVASVGWAPAGKTVEVNPGIRPITEGPSRMPPMTSAMTRGWRRRDRG